MSETPAESAQHTGSSRNKRLALMVAVIAVLLGGYFVASSLNSDSAGGGDPAKDSMTGPGGPSAEPDDGQGTAPAPSVTELSLGDESAMKCMVPNVKILRQQSLAFEGTVNAIDGQEVTLDVKTWFRGEPTDQAIVRTANPQLRLALSGVEFKRGLTYLVSATDNRVTMCGFSAEANAELAALFVEAYAE